MFHLFCLQKIFIQIVNPIIIRPRDGDAVTGYTKLRKTVSAIKVGKLFLKSYRDKKNKVRNQMIVYWI